MKKRRHHNRLLYLGALYRLLRFGCFSIYFRDMTSDEIRKKFLGFFKDREHAIVSSSSLVPDDPSVLLTTAGMQQFKKYYTGELDPLKNFKDKDGNPTKNTVSVQKCFRTSDIDEVGDESHLTFFEMLGNFSFGGYFKEEAIKYGYEFIKDVMGLEVDYVTVFDPAKVPDGDWRKDVPFDQESYDIWKKLGMPEGKIQREGVDNFWGPTGNEGPCGPTTEIYVRGVEIWNIVFNEYYCRSRHPDPPAGGEGSRDSSSATKVGTQNDKLLEPLKVFGVDTGMGLERLTMVSQNAPTIFETDLFKPLMDLLPRDMDTRTRRIFADHARGIAFLVSDGVRPSNKEAGYVLRRLMRRIIVYGGADMYVLFQKIVDEYSSFYPELNRDTIVQIFEEEWGRFEKTLSLGLKELDRMSAIDAKTAFKLYESFGLPYEIIKERGRAKARGLAREDFDAEFKKHQEISRAGKEAKFGGHGLYLKTGEVTVKDKSELEKVTRLHTATHLMHAGLRAVLGPEARQNGSDITVERTRFDFNFPRKVTPEELKKVENWVNDAIKKNLKVEWKEMSYEEAIKEGALGFFRQKYPERVKAYKIYDAKTGEVYSKELCGGPHVEHTNIIGNFKILKEEASSAGVRRIRGIVEP